MVELLELVVSEFVIRVFRMVEILVLVFWYVELAAVWEQIILISMFFYSVSLCYFWLIALWCICYGFYVLDEVSFPYRVCPIWWGEFFFSGRESLAV